MTRHPHTPATLPTGLRWVAGNSSFLGGCRGGHIALDDGKRGTLCGLIHGGDTRFGPTRLQDACKRCLRIALKER